MRTDSPVRIALAIVLLFPFAAAARAQEPERTESERCDCVRFGPLRDAAFSFAWPHRGGAQLGILLDDDAETDSIGARIREVVEDGPAEAVGLRPGDVITAIDGRSVARQDANDARPGRQLVRELREIEPGDTVRVDYRRDGQPLAANVVAGERASLFRARALTGPSFDIDIPDVPGLWRGASLDGVFGFGRGAGLDLADMNEALGDYFGVDHGVLVLEVRDESGLGLVPGDVILRVGDREVQDARHVRAIVSSYRDDEPVEIEIVRQGERQTIRSETR